VITRINGTRAGGIGPAAAEAEHGVPWSSGTASPKLKPPPNACDCHMHIYDSRFPVAPNATMRPPDASVDAHRLLQKRIGTARIVVVAPSTYGTDNSCTLDAMAQFGPAARGVAVVDTSVTDAELKRLNDLGVRGIRFNLVQSGATTVDAGTLSFTNIIPSSATWDIALNATSTPTSGTSGLLLLPATPSVTGKTINIVLTGTSTGFTWIAVDWTGNATGFPTLKLNGVTVFSGIPSGGTTVRYSTSNIKVTR